MRVLGKAAPFSKVLRVRMRHGHKFCVVGSWHGNLRRVIIRAHHAAASQRGQGDGNQEAKPLSQTPSTEFGLLCNVHEFSLHSHRAATLWTAGASMNTSICWPTKSGNASFSTR